jgi:peptidoglycan biosynthesis protein MviN/MurJ (putative lipid II flippase)
VLATISSAILISNSYELVMALYGRSLSSASASVVANVVRIAAIALPALALQVAFAQALYASRRIRVLALMAGVMFAIQVPLSPLLIFTMGYNGFAIANTAAQICVTVGYYVFLLKLSYVPRPSWMLLALIRAVAAAAGGVVLVSLFFPATLLDPVGGYWNTVLALAVRCLISMATIGVLLALLGDPLLRLTLRMIFSRGGGLTTR